MGKPPPVHAVATYMTSRASGLRSPGTWSLSPSRIGRSPKMNGFWTTTVQQPVGGVVQSHLLLRQVLSRPPVQVAAQIDIGEENPAKKGLQTTW